LQRLHRAALGVLGVLASQRRPEWALGPEQAWQELQAVQHWLPAIPVSACARVAALWLVP
jgi:hypothetical protein